ncbi:cobalt-zinc-cadmium efflux system membrane fusion protein [Mucilaginibacter yixingensis]|uniref:Cobalt-zinc-cadmium efflux system membrane fusion protein n=1 Tax=Mucilaginibacter yixingensis TaxID=1295612 RepID=A0A2T5JD87_9SPHI|nr:efflux RND transporter periplasmic adaptor subunit [Mucilaginibacter yixingensis]PTQ99731.1 cobalt-zinc-cadmium efflux system membrane fusion protein [Mucilaginibacter yixingensis]
MKIKIYTAVVIAAIMLTSCSGSSGDIEKNNKEEASKEAKPSKPGGLELTAQQMKNVGIEVGAIPQKNLDAVIKASGQLAVPPQNKADVSLLSGGLISHISVLEGQQVHKGQILATVNNQELIKIEQDYLAAKNNFTYVAAEYDRQNQLQAAGAGTGKSYQSAAATYKAEQARLKAYESQLKQLGISPEKISSGSIVSSFPVISPISGTVGKITANTGTYVQPGTSIMEVVDNSKIHCDLIVFEKDLMAVKMGQKVDFQLTNQQNMVITGRINGINKSFENESKGVIVHAEIDNREHQNLIPGMYVTALISIGSKMTAALPTEAVIRTAGKQYIFVVTGQNGDRYVFKKIEVATGTSELGYIAVSPMTDLPAGVKAVTKGAFYLESKQSGSDDED